LEFNVPFQHKYGYIGEETCTHVTTVLFSLAHLYTGDNSVIFTGSPVHTSDNSVIFTGSPVHTWQKCYFHWLTCTQVDNSVIFTGSPVYRL